MTYHFYDGRRGAQRRLRRTGSQGGGKRGLLRLSAFLRWTRGADGDEIEQLRRRLAP